MANIVDAAHDAFDAAYPGVSHLLLPLQVFQGMWPETNENFEIVFAVGLRPGEEDDGSEDSGAEYGGGEHGEEAENAESERGEDDGDESDDAGEQLFEALVAAQLP